MTQATRGFHLRPRWDVQGVRASGNYLYFQEIAAHLSGGQVRLSDGRQALMLGGYSYHGLGQHPAVLTAARQALETYGTTTHGSRFLAGTTALHRQLETRLATFLGVDDALVLGSGYVANVAAIPALLAGSRRPTVLADRRNHASLIDGCRQAGARLLDLRRAGLAALADDSATDAPRLVASDGVFSMEGDLADLPTLRRLADQHRALLYVDEAHSMFVLGATGRGLCEREQLPASTIDVHMGTLSKAIPSSGGYLAGSREVCEYLRHETRGFIYSGAPAPATMAAALAAIDLIDAEPWRCAELDRKSRLLRTRLRANGLDTGASASAIVPVILGPDALAFACARACQEYGLFVHPIIAPVVPRGAARLRLSVMSCHADDDLLAAADRIAEVVQVQRRLLAGAA